MKIPFNTFPSNIPYIFANFVTAIFFFYFMTGIILEMNMGRPGSTSGIGLFFIFFLSLIFYSTCFFIGNILKNIILKFTHERILSNSAVKIILLLFFLSVALASFSSGVSFVQYEKFHQPRVIFNSGEVEKIAEPNFKVVNQVEAKFIFSGLDDEKDKIESVSWNNLLLHCDLIENSNCLKLVDDTDKELASINLKGFDYITEVYAIPIKLPREKLKGLAALAHLRATSNRSMLLIYNSTAELIYQEHIERDKLENIMKVLIDASGNEYLSIDAKTPIYYNVYRPG